MDRKRVFRGDTLGSGLGILVVLLLAAGAAQAEIPGILEGYGTHFELNTSDYLNITVDSTVPINLTLESALEMVVMRFGIEPTASTLITMHGFTPNTLYYKYEDNYYNLTTFTADNNGNFSYTQNLTESHLVFIQPIPGTKHIKISAGGDCTLIGTWNDVARTCTLTHDLTESIQIDDNNIILDGNGKNMTGSHTGYGVFIPKNKQTITIKNLNIQNYHYGIGIHDSSYITVMGNNVSHNKKDGISLNDADSNSIQNNIFSSNGYFGIENHKSNNNFITGNRINSNVKFGIRIHESNGADLNRIYNNIFNNTDNYEIHEPGKSINTWNSTKTPGLNIIGGPNKGGNFWANPAGTGFSQTCTPNADGFCVEIYELNSKNIDHLPLAGTGIPGKSDQTITFGALSAKTYGDTPFGVSASASSGLPVSFTASGSCSIAGSTVSITGAGSCTVIANQSGNATYNPATDVSRSFTINKATATVILNDLTQTYIGSALTPTVITIPASLGIVFTVAPQINAGTYPSVIATVNDPNYQGSASGTFTINQVTPIITWNNPADITFGTALGATQLNAVASVPGGFVYTPPAGTVLGAGPNQPLHAAFTPSDLTNYTLASRDVTITVTGTLPTVRYINGTVMDNLTHVPLVGAIVSTTGGISSVTDGSGKYSLAVVSGSYPLTATYDIRYRTNSSVTVSTVLVAVVNQDIELELKPVGIITGTVRHTDVTTW